MRAFGGLQRVMWPCSIEGLEKLPEHERVLVVANHSGMGTAELCALSMEWVRRFGATRPFAGMAHPGAFRVPVLRGLLHSLGAVEATREGAKKAIDAGVPLLVFPGGDHEAARPFWQAKKVDFGGRTGWVRFAREHGLTIVPLAITGSHLTLPVLARSKIVAAIMGLRPLIGAKRAPVPLLWVLTSSAALAAARHHSIALRVALVYALYWATLSLPWLPARIGFRFLEPVDADTVRGSSDRDIYERVVGALGAELAKIDRGPTF